MDAIRVARFLRGISSSPSLFAPMVNPAYTLRTAKIGLLAPGLTGVVLVAVVALTTSGCRDSEPSKHRPVILTSFPVLSAIVGPVVGSAADVQSLLDAGKSPHAYDPKPSDARAASRAALIVFAADNLDRWVTQVAETRTLRLIDLLPDSLKYYPTRDSRHPDPHFWLDPLAVKTVVEALPDRLCEILAEGCDVLRANATSFADDLTVLDAAIRTSLQESGIDSSLLVISTPFFGYFVRRYGLNVAAVLGMSEALDAGPRNVVRLAEMLASSDQRVGAVVCEANESLVAARMVAEMVNARLVPVDPIGGSSGRQKYDELMWYNVRRLLGNKA